MTLALDTSGNVAVDFVWGNFPIQPDQARTGSGASVVVANNASQNHGWSGYSVYPSSTLTENNTTVTLNQLSYTVAPDNHVIAYQGWNSYPSTDAQSGVLPTQMPWSPITYVSGSGVVTGASYVTVPNVIGNNVQGAEDALHVAGLDVVIATRTSGATLANHDTVYSQSIAAGASSIAQGTSVTITVYKFHDASTNPAGNING
jgi:PASTA domain